MFLTWISPIDVAPVYMLNPQVALDSIQTMQLDSLRCEHLEVQPTAGVILSLPFGGLGAMIGLLFNPSYEKEKTVKVIFSVQLWILIWAVVSFMLFGLGYYSAGMGISG